MSDDAAKPDPRTFWNERYAAVGDAHLFGTAPSQFLAAQAHWLAGCRNVLCVADGEGRNSVWLAQHGFAVTATELSPVALAKADRFARARGVAVQFVETDILGGWVWPVSAYDAVVAIFIQFAAPAARAVLFEAIKGALRPGGILLLHGYTPAQIGYGTGGPSAVENLYTESQLRADFAGWEIVRLQGYERALDEGRGHAGRSALIDLVARKPL